MSTMAISKNNTVTMNKENTTNTGSLFNRFKNYVLDNAAYFAASSAMITGNSAAVVQIMKDYSRSNR